MIHITSYVDTTPDKTYERSISGVGWQIGIGALKQVVAVWWINTVQR